MLIRNAHITLQVRLRNINLRMVLRKHEGRLRAKEQLAEGLHLIDFEQLKIENQTLNEKVSSSQSRYCSVQWRSMHMVFVLVVSICSNHTSAWQ